MTRKILLLTLSLLFLSSPAWSYNWCTDDAANKGCYLMNVDEDPITDSSGEGNTLTNTGVTYTTGKYGKGALKDADPDKLQINSDFGLSTASDFSINFWWHPTSVGGSSDWRIAILEIDNARYYRIIQSSSTTITFDNKDDSTSYNYGANLETDKFHMITCIKSGTAVHLYFDGVLRDTGSYATSSTGSTVFSVFTQYNQTNATRGVIDDLAIFSKVLSQSEITNLYTDAGGAFLMNFI